MSRVQTATLETFVPLWLQADGPVAVAQLERPVEPVTAGATKPWKLATIGLAAMLAFCLLQTLRALRRQPAEAAPKLSDSPPVPEARAVARAADATDRRSFLRPPAAPEPSDGQMGTTSPPRRARPAPGGDEDLPLYAQAGFREIQQARDEAEQRARVAEERLHELQERFRLVAATETELQDARARIRELEAEVARLHAGPDHVVVETGSEIPRVILRPTARPEDVLPITERRG
ncbi:MAG TPA: hypothetical protein VF984_08670 [Actinomycetota bacterium]